MDIINRASPLSTPIYISEQRGGGSLVRESVAPLSISSSHSGRLSPPMPLQACSASLWVATTFHDDNCYALNTVYIRQIYLMLDALLIPCIKGLSKNKAGPAWQRCAPQLFIYFIYIYLLDKIIKKLFIPSVPSPFMVQTYLMLATVYWCCLSGGPFMW